MAEQQPNTLHWDRETEFTLSTAAWLLCNLEPRVATKDNPVPVAVVEMVRQLRRSGVKIMDTSRKVIHYNKITGGHYEETLPGAEYVTRAALLEWCERTGRRPPFLYSSERGGPSDSRERSEHGNAKVHERKQAELVLAAITLMLDPPTDCVFKSAMDVAEALKDHSYRFWGDKPPYKNLDHIARLISPYFQAFQRQRNVE